MMNRYQHYVKPILMGILFTCFSHAVFADERESLEQLRNTTLNLIDMLVKEGVLSKAGADNLIKEAQAAKQSGKSDQEIADQIDSSAEKVVRVQYVPESVKQQMKDEIKQDVMDKLNYKAGDRLGLPDWIDRITPTGDLRLRYESDKFSSGNAPYQNFNQSITRNSTISNTTDDQNRFRVRARFGANIKLTDWLDGGIRVTTGSLSNPLSANQTLNTSDAKFTIGLDRAYLTAAPTSWLKLSGGRMENPWFHTDLMWDPDLAFDGFMASADHNITDHFSAFGTVGAFPLQAIPSSSTNRANDKWLYATQAGIKWKLPSDSSLKVGLAYYDFRNIEGSPNDPNTSAFDYSSTEPAFRTKGNNTFDINYKIGGSGSSCGAGSNNAGCALASKFKVLDFTAQYDLANFKPVHVILTTDYIRNLGFDVNEIYRRTGIIYSKETQGYQAKLAVGMPETTHKGDWQVFGAYKRLEADSTVDAYTDDDFNLGGTDTKGWILGVSYGLDKNIWSTLRWFSTQQISGLPLSMDLVFLDLQAKF